MFTKGVYKKKTIIFLNSDKVNLRDVQAGAAERTRGWWWWWWTPATFLSLACPGDEDDNYDVDDEDEDGYNLDNKCLPYHQPLQEQEEKHGEEKKKAESQNLSFSSTANFV